mmetsp:Transcript_5382/g.14973  ORF Transcript_5382/g.14973 Transcript_5382/m.14973 type:complete len:217 (-) Transcript_5382:131-781(-)
MQGAAQRGALSCRAVGADKEVTAVPEECDRRALVAARGLPRAAPPVAWRTAVSSSAADSRSGTAEGPQWRQASASSSACSLVPCIILAGVSLSEAMRSASQAASSSWAVTMSHGSCLATQSSRWHSHGPAAAHCGEVTAAEGAGDTSEGSATRSGCRSKEDTIGRPANMSGWLHTLRSCMRTFIMPMKDPPAMVRRVSPDAIYSSYSCRCRLLSLQ